MANIRPKGATHYTIDCGEKLFYKYIESTLMVFISGEWVKSDTGLYYFSIEPKEL